MWYIVLVIDLLLPFIICCAWWCYSWCCAKIEPSPARSSESNREAWAQILPPVSSVSSSVPRGDTLILHFVDEQLDSRMDRLPSYHVVVGPDNTTPPPSYEEYMRHIASHPGRAIPQLKNLNDRVHVPCVSRMNETTTIEHPVNPETSSNTYATTSMGHHHSGQREEILLPEVEC